MKRINILIIAALTILTGISCSKDESEPNLYLPKLELITPIDNTDIKPGVKLTLLAEASDYKGEIKDVAFYINNVELGRKTTEPYSTEWNTSNLALGEYKLKVIATDNQNDTAMAVVNIILSNSFTCGNSFYDVRDGNIYKTVQIGDQCWMAQNLNFKTDSGSWAYNNSEELARKLGRLYDKSQISFVSPEGWHVPSDEEWMILEGTVDSQFGIGDSEWESRSYRGFDVGLKLRSTDGWSENRNGSNDFGFNMIPSGYHYNTGSADYFENQYFSASFWTSTTYMGGPDYIAREFFASNSESWRGSEEWSCSIRCIKD